MFGFIKSKKRNTRRKVIRQNTRIKSERKKREGSLFVRLHGKPNLPLIAIVSILLVLGILMIYSASYYYGESRFSDPFHFVKNQIIYIILGLIIGYFVYITPINLLRKASPLLLAICFLVLLYMLPEALFGETYIDANGNTVSSGAQMPLVIALNGATRWIDLYVFNLQPSEVAKFAFAIYMAGWVTKERNTTSKNASKLSDHITNVILPFLVLLGVMSMLILLQRDFDTTVLLVLTILIIYYISGTDFLHTIGSVIILVSTFLFGLVALLLESYRRQRVETFLHIFRYGTPAQDDQLQGAFQVWNGLVGYGSGGIFGNGYAESVIKQGYLQEAAYTDSIFAIIGDEFGFVGSLFIILAFLLIASIGFKIATEAKTKFNALLAVGMTTLIVLQALLNIAAVLVIIPFGGMPLPFFTYGGTNIIMNLVIVAVLLNISKENNFEKKEEKRARIGRGTLRIG